MPKRRKTERRFIAADTQPVELRAGADGAPSELVGYAAVFDQWTAIQDFWGDAWLESIAPGAYAKTLAEADIRALWNHDTNVVLGRNRAGTLALREDATGLHVTIRPPDNEWGRPVLDAVRRGDVTGQSIAFQAIKEQWQRPEKKGDLARRTILEARLVDVGPVTFPAFAQTSVQARSQGADDAGDMGVIGQAFRLARLAEHGYALDADERAQLGAAVAILRRVSAEPAGDGHSAAAQNGEPEGIHSAEARARRLKIIAMHMEVGK